MDTERRRDSAVIYPFPPGGRAAARRGTKPAQAVVAVPSGRGWYHDVAISDDEKGKGPEPRA